MSWQSLHVHYNSDPHWLLTEGIGPVVDDLTSRGLIESHFFILYWERGPHIRLRFKPKAPGLAEQAKATAVAALERFLEGRPSIFSFPTKNMPESYRAIFIDEYGPDALLAKYGPDGLIPYEQNNCVREVPYDPEYRRYGGVRGMAIAERFFQASSEVAMQLRMLPNGHDARVLLGHALRGMYFACLIHLGPENGSKFLNAYGERWDKFGGKSGNVPTNFEEKYLHKYERQRESLRAELQACKELLDGVREATATERRWIDALIELRDSWRSAISDHELELPSRGKSPGGADAAAPSFGNHPLVSCLHMHNNRLGVSISSEMYLAYLGAKAMAEHDES